jgi:excinuclease ABC subunit C
MNRTKNESRLDLRAHVRAETENRPGVYRFLGPRGEVLYVGKSIRIRARLLSYFRGVQGKEWELLRVAQAVEWEYVPNPFEATLREFRLIRAFRPRYNREFRRDRAYAWIRLTRGAAPRLVASRRPPLDGSKSWGPFPAQKSLPQRLRELAELCGLRDCPGSTPVRFSEQLDLLSEPTTRPRVRAEFSSCLAPCSGRCSFAAYPQGVREAEAFLMGRTNGPLDRLSQRMQDAANREAFELAARLRDREAALRALRDRVVSSREEEARLSFVYRIPGPDRAARIYLLQRGRVALTADEPGASEREVRNQLIRQIRDLGTPGDRGHRGGPRSGGPRAQMELETREEEFFLVARWFRSNPAELDRTQPPGRYLEWLGGSAAADGISSRESP